MLLVLATESRSESSFREIARLGVGRNSHTATLIEDGRVIIVGGKNARHQAIANVEVFDPVSGSFFQISQLLTARHSHHATLLPDQKLLITGGGAGAEFLNFADGVWTSADPSDGHAGGDSATLLNDGQVLVIGGMDNAQQGIARLYHSPSNTWARAGSLTLARRHHTATRLTDGRVLVCGGSDYPTGRITALAEIYDPSSGKWTSAGALTVPRQRHTATLLTDGKILVCGGNNRDALASTELYDPAAGTWTSTSPLSIPRENHTAVLLPDNQVLVCGGVPIASTVLASSELYDPVSGNWMANDTLASSRCLHATTRIANGDILVTGGWGAYNRSSPGAFNLAIRDVETYGPPAPEIALVENLTDLTIGDTSDFGTVPLGGESIRRFTLKNVGSEDLKNLSFAVSGTNAAAFNLTPNILPSTLAAKSAISFTIRFSPTLTGSSAVSLVIVSNDANEGNFNISLTGTGTTPTTPEITVRSSADLIDAKAKANYGRVKLRSDSSFTFTIQNTGTADLSGISIRKFGKNKNDFTIGFLAKTTLPPGESTTIKLTFNPSATGNRTANLRILSNDADESPFDIILTGRGIKR